MDKIKVGILGATGMVGQRFVQLLADHPWFEISALAASERSVGMPYGEACHWVIAEEMPTTVKEIVLQGCKPDLSCRLVFSALPAEVAGPVEEEFATAGYAVSSNASSYRLAPDVPLLVPEVNPDHLALIEIQQRRRGWKGFIVTNPNCSTAQLVLALKPLWDRFGITALSVVTLQALSGAGYPGVPSLDILDNVIPYIAGEEGKVEREPLKLLGQLEGEAIREAEIAISAQCHRVATREGHLEAVSVKLGQEAGYQEVVEALRGFRGPLQGLGLPSAPEHPIVVREEVDRPQPRLDRDEGKGMSVVVGRVRECPVLDYKFILLGHNTIRGAAGAAILNAELLASQGYLDFQEDPEGFRNP
ncbi:MAG: aspartate-semialdehyde dehydrogenase [Chloroflexi bacterium]|nr:aspartate-semialdehyde dehydrogenase [Chloroflexota bacterium]